MTSAPHCQSSQVYYIQYDKSANLSINVNLSLASMSLDSYSDLIFPTSLRDSLYNISSLSILFLSVLTSALSFGPSSSVLSTLGQIVYLLPYVYLESVCLVCFFLYT